MVDRLIGDPSLFVLFLLGFLTLGWAATGKNSRKQSLGDRKEASPARAGAHGAEEGRYDNNSGSFVGVGVGKLFGNADGGFPSDDARFLWRGAVTPWKRYGCVDPPPTLGVDRPRRAITASSVSNIKGHFCRSTVCFDDWSDAAIIVETFDFSHCVQSKRLRRMRCL